MSDLIERQAAIDALEEYADRLQMVNWKENPGVPYKAYALNWCINTIRDLPSAQPEPRPKRGKWETEVRTIRGHKIAFFACSVCGRNADGEYPYCPNCGAKMDDDWEEPEINPCRGCGDYDGRGGCKSRGGCGAERSE